MQKTIIVVISCIVCIAILFGGGFLLGRRAADADYLAALEDSRREANDARDAASRSEARYSDLAGRLDTAIGGADAGAEAAGRIADGLDGDADLARSAHDAIRQAFERLQGLDPKNEP